MNGGRDPIPRPDGADVNLRGVFFFFFGSRILISRLHLSSSAAAALYVQHHAGGEFARFFLRGWGALRVTHSVGTTCRELDSFLRGDADELREETCGKMLFIDAIRIPGGGGGEAHTTTPNKYTPHPQPHPDDYAMCL